ncbi:hypothetical protein B296_00045739 [Ensete ventricosum]|uniref:Uncharacterized protein n=1 Tax=Ensete ventricosum TaxID=4639 RepID=A0A426X3A5_ENSVE|nr:hypothetical protein B296_00045739 [Ensete ventricosum]
MYVHKSKYMDKHEHFIKHLVYIVVRDNLLGAPHDVAASSLVVAALAAVAASNCTPCCCTSLLPPCTSLLPLLPLLAAPCSSPDYCSNRCPSLLTPPFATTAAPIISNQLFDILVILTPTISL